MNDQTNTVDSPTNRPRTIDLVRKTLDRRYRAERRFQWIGLAAIICGLLFLVVMFASIIGNGYSAFYQSYVQLDVTYDPEKIDPQGNASEESLMAGNYGGLLKQKMREMYPMIKGRRDKKLLYSIVSSGAGYEIRDRVMADKSLLGQTETLWLLLDDDADMFFKGYITDIVRQRQEAKLRLAESDGLLTLSTDAPVLKTIVSDVRRHLQDAYADADRDLKRFERQLEQHSGDEEALSSSMQALRDDIARLEQELATNESSLLSIPEGMSSYLVKTDAGYLKLKAVAAGKATGEWLLKLDEDTGPAAKSWEVIVLAAAESNRRTSDKGAAILLSLQDQGSVDLKFNTVFFTAGDSREPELSGILSAAKGFF